MFVCGKAVKKASAANTGQETVRNDETVIPFRRKIFCDIGCGSSGATIVTALGTRKRPAFWTLLSCLRMRLKMRREAIESSQTFQDSSLCPFDRFATAQKMQPTAKGSGQSRPHDAEGRRRAACLRIGRPDISFEIVTVWGATFPESLHLVK
jgi:hypothetical protein